MYILKRGNILVGSFYEPNLIPERQEGDRGGVYQKYQYLRIMEKISTARFNFTVQPITKREERDSVIQEIVSLIDDPEWNASRIAKRINMNVKPCDTQSLRALIHSVSAAYNDRYSTYTSWAHAFFARTKSK